MLMRQSRILLPLIRRYSSKATKKPVQVSQDKDKYHDTQEIFNEVLKHPLRKLPKFKEELHNQKTTIPPELKDEFSTLKQRIENDLEEERPIGEYDPTEHVLLKLLFAKSLDEVEQDLPKVTKSILNDSYDHLRRPLRQLDTALSDLSVKSNVLKVKRRDMLLIKSDFERVLPSKYERQFEYDDLDFEVVQGRLPNDLSPTGIIYLIFPDFRSAGCYYLETHNKELNGSNLGLNFVDVAKELPYIYPSTIPDLEVSPYLNAGTVTKNPDITNLPGFIQQTKVNEAHSESKETSNRPLLASNEEMPFGHVLLRDQDSQPRNFKRSQACIFINLPLHVKGEELQEFLWDYNLYGTDSSCIRHIGDTNWLVIFDTQLDRDRCVRNLDRRHWYNNSEMPLVGVEAL